MQFIRLPFSKGGMGSKSSREIIVYTLTKKKNVLGFLNFLSIVLLV